MTDKDKIREAFEKWYLSEGWKHTSHEKAAFIVWQAALADDDKTVVVETSPTVPPSTPEPSSC